MEMYNEEAEIRYKSWVDADDTEWRDEMGHGTHLSVLLRKTAPDAIIFNGRVFKGQPPDESVKSLETIAKV
jgi:hypothetical protein